MTNNPVIEAARAQAMTMLQRAHVPLSEEEKLRMQVWDFGLGDISRYGVQIMEYINNERYCARQLVLLPRQTIPEHMHPPVGEDPGKVETFRVVWGKVWVYTEGEPTSDPQCDLNADERRHFSVFHQIELNAGQQYTIGDNKRHWFHAGDDGAVVIEFSSPSRDEFDVFTDVRVGRT